ncbi:MAG: 50S ribosomal protein L23 [Thermodesulfovibrionales bacterium]|nr:50S ribosomal protein L23 [Thermodesulfovibrionales bacterium]
MKSVYQIIKRPLFTEKGAAIKEADNKLLFEVFPGANKAEIKRAVEEIFKVKVDKVATLNVRGKIKAMGRFKGKRADWKKAIVTLKQGENLDLIEGV